MRNTSHTLAGFYRLLPGLLRTKCGPKSAEKRLHRPPRSLVVGQCLRVDHAVMGDVIAEGPEVVLHGDDPQEICRRGDFPSRLALRPPGWIKSPTASRISGDEVTHCAASSSTFPGS